MSFLLPCPNGHFDSTIFLPFYNLDSSNIKKYEKLQCDKCIENRLDIKSNDVSFTKFKSNYVHCSHRTLNLVRLSNGIKDIICEECKLHFIWRIEKPSCPDHVISSGMYDTNFIGEQGNVYTNVLCYKKGEETKQSFSGTLYIRCSYCDPPKLYLKATDNQRIVSKLYPDLFIQISHCKHKWVTGYIGDFESFVTCKQSHKIEEDKGIGYKVAECMFCGLKSIIFDLISCGIYQCNICGKFPIEKSEPHICNNKKVENKETK